MDDQPSIGPGLCKRDEQAGRQTWTKETQGTMIDWITTAEARKLTGYHIEYVRRLIRSGQIDAQKWRREWMVDRKSVLAYMQQERRPGPKKQKSPGE
jgi:excisionase family DNA binding protein